MAFYLYSLSGLVVGILVGLTGVGGGSLMTPLLILLFGVHPATAVGSDLLYAAATKAVGTGVHGFRQSVDWKVVRLLATGSVPMTALTLAFASLAHLSHDGGSGFVKASLGGVLILTSLVVMFRTRAVKLLGGFVGEVSDHRRHMLTIAAGATLGVLVTLTSVGAGAMGVTALIVLYPHLPTSRLVGSDIAHAVPLALLAGMGHWWLGDVNFALVGALLLGSVPGVIIGSLWSVKVPDPCLRAVLATVLLIVGVRLVM
ncbi:sulfite exporter TauE/SafE family protein [Aquabacter sp. L1I39]|uniref:sulfite exporter TauE/SafE family protein n=1 Tax=Aquabacter sp. L1I39 TaxID=2820278 RepID=UPI001ADA6830|nr:sulfite exporter TauE/SafE family protein [Aquabacter sp. L1I39]QTL05337.1 sulfite exporter TauE/SafE family protein [Aquabacter sp. L1I39]